MLVLIALALALLIKAFIVQAFYIPSDSMMNTLQRQDRVLVNKVVYDLRDIRRGEVIVFRGDESWGSEVPIPEPTNPVQRFARWVGGALGVTHTSEKDFIKRVVAVGGDTVACCDPEGRVTVNGQGLVEPYVFQNGPLGDGSCTRREFGPIKVPQNRLWVMGDHRSASADSRCHLDSHNGTIAESSVIGRAFVIVWPVDRVSTLEAQGDLVVASNGKDNGTRGSSAQGGSVRDGSAQGGNEGTSPFLPASVAAVALLAPFALWWRRRRARARRAGNPVDH